MPKKTNIRLILSIIVALLDEAIIFFILIFILSQLGIEMPLWLVVILSFILVAITFVMYRVLKKEPLLGFDNMIGKNGITVSPLTPRGTVKIANELWQAESSGGNISKGSEIVVVGQTGLKLTVTNKA